MVETIVCDKGETCCWRGLESKADMGWEAINLILHLICYLVLKQTSSLSSIRFNNWAYWRILNWPKISIWMKVIQIHSFSRVWDWAVSPRPLKTRSMGSKEGPKVRKGFLSRFLFSSLIVLFTFTEILKCECLSSCSLFCIILLMLENLVQVAWWLSDWAA